MHWFGRLAREDQVRVLALHRVEGREAEAAAKERARRTRRRGAGPQGRAAADRELMARANAWLSEDIPGFRMHGR